MVRSYSLIRVGLMANTGSTKTRTSQADAAAGDAIDVRTDAGDTRESDSSRKSRRRTRRSGRRSRTDEKSKSSVETYETPGKPESPAVTADALHFQSASFLCGPQVLSTADDPLCGYFGSDTSKQFSELSDSQGLTYGADRSSPAATAQNDAGELLAELRAIRESLLQEVRTQFSALRDDQDDAFQAHETLVRRTWQRIRSQFRSGPTVAPVAAQPAPAAAKPAATVRAPQPSTPSPATPAAGGNRSWEQIRKDFLDACDSEAESAEVGGTAEIQPRDPADALLSEIEALNSSGADSTGQQFQEEHLPDMEVVRQRMADSLSHILDSIPAPINADELDGEQMRVELLQRDEYIARMVRACRQVEEHRAPLLTMDQMQALAHYMPQESREVYQQAVARIQELNRMSEMEMSFERTRLVRERIVLQRVRQHLESSAGQLGMVLNEDGTLSRSEDGAKQPGNMRWLRKLGLAQRS